MSEDEEEKALEREEEHEKHPEDEEQLEIRTGESDSDMYTESGREQAMEEDTISPAEEGFMEGEEQNTEEGTCEQCGKVLGELADEVVERKLGEDIHFFCSDECAEKYKKKDKSE